MTEITFPFGELRPDIAILDQQVASIADNVWPGENSYKSMPSLVPLSTAALPAPCVGLYAARRKDTTWKIFGGTATKLYNWTLTNGWTDVSRTVGGNYAVPNNAQWSFSQFGTNLVATDLNDVVQVIDIEAGTNFAALGGSPPNAQTVFTLGNFLVLAGISGNRRQLQWSAINNITGWTSGINLSDLMEMPDGGPVQGIAGSETIGYLVQDRTVRTMQFLPGDTNFIFNITRVVKDRGSVSPYGFISVGDILYFLAEDGFFALAGSQLMPIGQDKVNEFFLGLVDIGRLNAVGCNMSSRPHLFVFWPFSSSTAPAGVYDRAVLYNWTNQKFATLTVQAQAWALGASLGVDLETTTSETNDAFLDATPQPQTLDAFAYVGGRPQILAVNTAGQLCSLTGPSMNAVIETAELQPSPGMRSFIADAYPLIDDSSLMTTVQNAARERLADPINYGTAAAIEKDGKVSIVNSGRFHRFRATMPPASTWNNAIGIRAEVVPDGYA